MCVESVTFLSTSSLSETEWFLTVVTDSIIASATVYLFHWQQYLTIAHALLFYYVTFIIILFYLLYFIIIYIILLFYHALLLLYYIYTVYYSCRCWTRLHQVEKNVVAYC